MNEFRPGITKEMLMYGSPEEFVVAAVNRMRSQVNEDGSNFDEVYDSYFKKRLESTRTPDEEIAYIKSERENIRKALAK